MGCSRQRCGVTMQILGGAGGSYSGVAPTMGSATSAAGGWSATITNYDAAFTYSATTTAGSVSISGSTITQSGLSNGASSTVTVTTTRSGYESATGTVSGTSFSQLATPTLSAATSAVGSFSLTITNYDAANGYTVTSTAGTPSRSGSTITVSGLGNGASATVSVTATRAGFVNSATATQSGSASNQLATPTLSASTSTAGGFTFTITNYDAANTYTVTTSAGSVSRSGGTVTQSGLGYSVSATVSVTASRSGFVTSATATRAGTSNAAPPCVPAGCTPPCGSATFSGATACGGSVRVCDIPGCIGSCVRWALDCYTYSAQTCYDNCGVPTTATCSSFCVDSTVSSQCCP
jgi:hypothetical protein